ncbi:redoxin domain-containing protein [Rhizobium laguerreae]|uniref:redoxin domain-containing protein n=1 Tax=Rhizobium laguerreae TaxID=1076926 RepID=UPI001C8FFE46|nr:redoxin domain-containing protein [Rhizobium laguerreae]MBY3259926.1 redoxin domain-containing protein [Rhizobium laguerreae]MBY3287386.1 redoxin domain-containing protein [Rhizobium laguerreae]MBY3294275.1 redoxin domain-containing protein [Rhizobium laguerreae]
MTPGLGIETPAPSIKVQHWLRGDPLFNFQLGKIYILGFVSTACSGCGPALVRLAQLQEQYRDIGIEVIGIAANEQAATADGALAQVDVWVTKWLPDANIRIGFDYSGEMDKHWKKASLTFPVPQAYVVDRDGSIVFIGPPHLLKEVLPKVIDGRWRTSAEAKNAEEERIAKAEIDAPKRALFDRIKAATEIEDWKTALSAIEEGIKGRELTERILRLCPQHDAPSRSYSYLTIASYYHESGDNDRAVDLIEQALKFVDVASLPDVEKNERMVHLLHTLAEYKGEQVCYGEICVPPPKQS